MLTPRYVVALGQFWARGTTIAVSVCVLLSWSEYFSVYRGAQ